MERHSHGTLLPFPPAPAQETSGLTCLEAGFNLNYTKALARLLRDRGMLQALTPRRKVGVRSGV